MTTQQQMTKQQARHKLHVRWWSQQKTSPNKLSFEEWLEKQVGLQFCGWRVVRNKDGNVELQKIN